MTANKLIPLLIVWATPLFAETLPAPAFPIGDKTLVAWVTLANTSQRAGAALTLINKAEQFDAIVFAEKEPRRWMAGSDFFRRTSARQSDWPVENADANTVVQVAIVYEGKTVTIYRDAQPYAEYTISAPQIFKEDVMVLLGMRYVGQMGEIGPLIGAIDDARVYGGALPARTIRNMKPNELSVVEAQPLAWWNFEEGNHGDRRNLFPAQKLIGSARVADGKLHLDGKGFLWAARDERLLTMDDMFEGEDDFDMSVQSLFYKARSKRTGNMWDVWLYHHDDTYYLYYLAKSGRRWDNISMARSPDGVHWTEIGRVLRKGPGVTWMGTGSTWKSPNFEKDGKFQINFSEWKGPRQNIFFAESTNLVDWKRLEGEEYRFVQDERWYKPNGRWDCIWTLARPGGGLYGYWTGSPKPETGGQFGFGETTDGVHWKALPPPKVHYRHGEVGAIEKIGERYYMLFGHYPLMVALTADDPMGPFHPAKKNLHLFSHHTYFARFFRTPESLLICHHAIARNGQVSFSPLKTAVVDWEGTLRFGWWPGNEKMKHEAVEVVMPENVGGAVAMLGNTFDVKTGIILEGTLTLPEKPAGQRRGLYVETAKDRGAAILFDSDGRAEIGPMHADGTGFKAEERIDREMAFEPSSKLRLLLRGSLLECYLSDILVECYSLPEPATGRIGLMLGGDSESICDLRSWK